MNNNPSALQPTKRFSNRVDYYVKYRPGYPAALIPFLNQELGLTPASIIADVGSGTGLLAKHFLDNGNTLYAVEPNDEMRAAGETFLAAYPHFHSVNGTAETTTLPSHSVDFVTAGQAFHWFDPPKAKIEFARIMRPGGYVILVWNDRPPHANSFMSAYETLLDRYAVNYHEVNARRSKEGDFSHFYGPAGYQVKYFDNYQLFDYDSLRGRLLSSSYAPLEDHPNHAPMIAGLKNLYKEYQQDGLVRFEYETQVYYGRLSN
jgi:SAM-dependent methyltransferase